MQSKSKRLTTGERLTYLEQRLTRTVVQTKGHMVEWVRRFEENPADALRWSQDLFRYAADLALAETMLADLSALRAIGQAPDEIYSKLRESLVRPILRASRYVTRSTSAPSDLLDQETLAAKGRLLNSPPFFE